MKRLWGLGIGLALLWATAAHAADTVYYYYTDEQGSPEAVTDASGTVIEQTQYAPYGQVLNRQEHEGPGYTGHEEDSETGLTNMQQRYALKVIGRMISTDPVDVDPNTGANFNRYAYASDNPYRYTDPDGRLDTPNWDEPLTQRMDAMLAQDQEEKLAKESMVASGDTQGGGAPIQGATPVPQKIERSGHIYSTPDRAAKAFGDSHYAQGVKDKSEFQTGVVSIAGGYDYIVPSEAPSGATVVNVTAFFNAIARSGYNKVAWAHTHWDGVLNFSQGDMGFVSHIKMTMYLTNRNDKTFMLNYRMLSRAAFRADFQGAEGILEYIQNTKQIEGSPVQ
jgi:RHS repeat-associated protein